MVFLSTLASSQTPSGMAAQAAMLIGVSTFQSACWRTCGKSCSDTTSSIATTVTTMSAEPKRIAKIGAISMAEPKPGEAAHQARDQGDADRGPQTDTGKQGQDVGDH